MPTGPASSSYIIPPLTLSDTFYEWYTLTNNEVIDKLNRLKVYQLVGATGIGINQSDDGIATAYLAPIIPGNHVFNGEITFNGVVTTINSNLITMDDYNLVLGAVNSDGGNGGTSDSIITTAGGGGLVIAGACGDKYFLWKSFDGGRTYSGWRISDSLAFTGDAKFYSNNNKFVFSEGDDNTPESKMIINTYGTGITIGIESYFRTPGTTFTNIKFLNDGSSQMINSSVIKRFDNVQNIALLGLTFGMVIRHDSVSGGITLAKANSDVGAESIGIIVNLNDTLKFADVNLLGFVVGNFGNAIASADGASSLGTGEFYFLSDNEQGKISKFAPTITGSIRKPILYALGYNSAIVMNYVGNKIVNIDSLYSKLNASTVVIKHDAGYFAVGDTVRFEEGVTSATRPYGSYIKASCNNTEEAEALGIISTIGYAGNSAASLMTVSGFVDLSSSGLTFVPGSVYFLSSVPGKLSLTSPITVNTVRKPMLVAISPTTGIVQNYVGLVINTNTDTGTSILIPESGSGFKNKLINGNFDFWQRGITFGFRNPTTEQNRYTADRWKLVNSGGTTADRLSVQINKSPLILGELVGSNVYSQNCLEFSIGTGGFTGDSETFLYQRVEGIEQLPSGYATLSFYAKASVSNAKLGVGFRRDFGGGTAPDYATTGIEQNSQKNTGFTTTLPIRWQRFSHTFSLPDSSGGIIGASGTDGPEIKFYVRAGSTFAGKDVTEEINPNLAGVNNYTIQLAQIQLEVGQGVSPFELNDPTTDLNRCLRYYQTTASDPVFYRNLTTVNVNNADSINTDLLRISPRYLVEIRDPVTCTLDIIDSASKFSGGTTTKGKKGFNSTTTSTALTYVQYQVESEL